MKAAPYEFLAACYDRLMQGVDYGAWVEYVSALVARFGGAVRRVVDLACGTGGSTLPWAERGCEVVGVDVSAEMLARARLKAAEKGLDIAFLQQDIRSLSLPEPVDLAVCFQDGLNYLLEAEDLLRAFRAVAGNLLPGGFFVFDLNYPDRAVGEVPGGEGLAAEGDLVLSWRAGFEGKLWVVEVAGVFRDAAGARREFRERHVERIYGEEEVFPLLAEAGFTVLGSYHIFTFDPPHAGSPRLVFVARRV